MSEQRRGFRQRIKDTRERVAASGLVLWRTRQVVS